MLVTVKNLILENNINKKNTIIHIQIHSFLYKRIYSNFTFTATLIESLFSERTCALTLSDLLHNALATRRGVDEYITKYKHYLFAFEVNERARVLRSLLTDTYIAIWFCIELSSHWVAVYTASGGASA